MGASRKTDLGDMTALELTALFKEKKASPVEAVKAVLERVDRFNPSLNAFAFVTPDAALAAARESEARWLRGEPASLIDGVPATIKEMSPVIGVPWRKGSITGTTEPSSTEILVVRRLRQGGAAIIGTTTSPELAWKGVTDGPVFGATRNPWNPERASGGSSGGAAVAAALNLGMLHEGSDAAGSIRIPASFCGVLGVKPGMGRIPADAPTNLLEMTQRGPLARTAEDAALFLSMTTKPFPAALYGESLDDPPDWLSLALRPEVRKMRIGYSRALGYAKVEPEVARAIDQAACNLESLGCVVEEADPGFPDPQQALRTIWRASQACNLDQAAPTEEQKKRMDPGLLDAADKGRGISAVDFIQALQVSARLKGIMADYFQRFDAMILPATPLTAFAAGIDWPEGADMEDWTDWSPFTYPFNMTGLPAASVPCGFDSDGMPIGLQIVGPKRTGDATVFALCAAYLQAFPAPFATGSR